MPATATPEESSPRRLRDVLLRRDNPAVLLHSCLAVFALFTLFMAFWHSPWRDEAVAWLYARDLSWPGLFYMTRHDGHPALWFVSLILVQATGANYLGMMVLNWAFCVWGIWLLFYRSALPLAARLGLAFVPTCLMELAFVARDYAIAMPLVFLAACFYPTSRDRPLRYCVVLALLASTNVFAAGVFAGISLQFLLEQAWDGGHAPFSLRPLFTKFLVANTVLALGAVALILQLVPLHFRGDPFPDVLSSLTPDRRKLLHALIFVLFFIAAAFALFRRTPRVVGAMPTIALITIPIFTYGWCERHEYMIVLGITYYSWVYLDDFIAGGMFGPIRMKAWAIKTLVTLFILLPALRIDYDYVAPFHSPASDSRAAAQAIIAHGFDRPGTMLVSNDSFRSMPLFLFLRNIRDGYVPPEFGPSPQSFALVGYLKASLDEKYTADSMKAVVLDAAAQHPGAAVVVIVSGKGLLVPPRNDDPAYQLTPIYLSPANFIDEGYRILELKRK